MSLEVLTAKFEAHVQECATDKAAMLSDMKEVRATMESKVSFKHFYWIIGILVTIQMAVLGYIIMQLKDLDSQVGEVSKVTTAVQVDVSGLKGKLAPYEVQYAK